MEDIESKIVNVQEQLRGLEKEIGQSERRGFGSNGPFERRPITFREGGGRDGGRDRERGRVGMDAYGYGKRRHNTANKEEEEEDEEPRVKRSLQSTVIMPAIETKSREEKIQELAKTEKKEVVNRNRRMFSNLLQGTLTGFKKASETEKARVKRQEEALSKVEKEIEQAKAQAKEEAEKTRQEKIEKRRELENEMRSLTRQKALVQYADARIKQLNMLSNFIMTTTQPCIFFKPAIANIRSTELKRNTEKTIEKLIEMRNAELKRELETPFHVNDEEEGLKSFVSKSKRNGEEIKSEEEPKDEIKKEKNGEEKMSKKDDDKKRPETPNTKDDSNDDDEEDEEQKVHLD